MGNETRFRPGREDNHGDTKSGLVESSWLVRRFQLRRKRIGFDFSSREHMIVQSSSLVVGQDERATLPRWAAHQRVNDVCRIGGSRLNIRTRVFIAGRLRSPLDKNHGG